MDTVYDSLSTHTMPSAAHSWMSYHAHQYRCKVQMKAVTMMFPLFQEKAASPTKITHVMKVIIKSTNFLNPTQVPVIRMDNPLYEIGKQLQWIDEESLGKNKLVTLPGGLHIEKNIL